MDALTLIILITVLIIILWFITRDGKKTLEINKKEAATSASFSFVIK